MADKTPNSYKVVLKTGDYGIFTNENFFDNYENRLLSGIYSIMPKAPNQNVPITPDTVASITQVCSHCQADLPPGPGDRFCEFCQGRTWVAAPEYNS